MSADLVPEGDLARGWKMIAFVRSGGVLAFAAAALCGVAACSTVETRPATIAAEAQESVIEAAVVYTLPRTLVRVQVPNGYVVGTASLSARQVALATIEAPDPDHVYELSYMPSATAADEWEVTVDAETGFLEGLNATATDRTGQIIAEAAKSYGRTLTPSPAARADGVGENPKDILIFDPNDPAQLAAAKTFFKDQLGLELACKHGCTSGVARAQEGGGMLYYRAKRPLAFEVCNPVCAPEHRAEVQGFYNLLSYNESPIYGVAPRRSLAVTRETKIVFENGAPTKVTVNKESELLEIVKMPGNTIGALFEGVTSRAQDEQKTLAAIESLYEAENSLLRTHLALLQTRADYQTTISGGGGVGGHSGQAEAPTGFSAPR